MGTVRLFLVLTFATLSSSLVWGIETRQALAMENNPETVADAVVEEVVSDEVIGEDEINKRVNVLRQASSKVLNATETDQDSLYNELDPLNHQTENLQTGSPFQVDQTIAFYGIRGSGGYFHDSAPPKRTDAFQSPTYSAPFGTIQLQMGLEHVFLPVLTLGAELYGGPLYIAQHTVSFDGYVSSSFGGNLGVDLTLRYYPAELGFLIGASLGAEWYFFSSTVYSAFSPSLRIGYGFDIYDQMGHFELFFKTPVIGGLSAGIETSSSLAARKHEPNKVRLYEFGMSLMLSF